MISHDSFLRRVVREDIEALQALFSEAFGSRQLGDFVGGRLHDYCNLGQDAVDINQQAHESIPVEYWAIIVDDVVQGMCGIYRINWAWEGTVWLGWFATSVERQKMGLGTAAVRRMAELASLRGGEVLKVETVNGGAAEAFYLKRGFRKEGVISHHYGRNLDAAILTMELSACTSDLIGPDGTILLI